MKKFLGILVLGLLFCNIAKAKECEGSPFVEKKNTLILFKIFVKWKDCHGKLTYKNGSKYVGGFKNENYQAKELLHGEKVNLLERNTLENF